MFELTFEVIERRAEITFAVARDDRDDAFSFSEFLGHLERGIYRCAGRNA